MVTYDISIRPNRTGKAAVGRGVAEFALGRFPALRREGDGRYVHQSAAGHSLMGLQLEGTERIGSIRVNIPGVLLRAESGNVLRLCFDIADQLGWGILDEQLGTYIERDAIPEVLNRYQFTGETVTEFLTRKTAGRAGFTDLFRYHVWPQTRKGMLICIGIASLIAGSLVLHLETSVNAFPWFGGAAFIAVITTKAAAQSIVELRKRGGSTPDQPAP